MSAETKTSGTNVKETVISIIIAFAMAFVFRGFVIEAFLIPTGSMAPTLMGQHMRFTSPQTGHVWSVGPWSLQPNQEATPIQRSSKPGGKILVHDPASGIEVNSREMPRQLGDRIFVMKYLSGVYSPRRFDVTVFKNPTNPTVNYIKRLIGMPNEMVSLVDGDVFARPIAGSEDARAENLWNLSGWTIQRKPMLAQEAVWQFVFDSEQTPLSALRGNPGAFMVPWLAAEAQSAQWQIRGRRDYVYTGSGATSLTWDEGHWPLTDRYAYNEDERGSRTHYPVGDLRVSAGIRPESAGLKASAVVVARQHEFRCVVDGSATPAAVTLEMRPLGVDANAPWSELTRATAPGAMQPAYVTNIDFWHVDQSLRLFVNEREVAYAEYDWSLKERLFFGVNSTPEQVMNSNERLTLEVNYTRPGIRWDFSGGGFTMYRASVARDLHYQAALYHSGEMSEVHTRRGQPAMGTHPKSTAVLGPDDFFFCGDNSPSSLDGRLWDLPSPWVREVNPNMGLVNRDLLIGKAFFVYFPSPVRKWGVPVPNFGDLRFVW